MSQGFTNTEILRLPLKLNILTVRKGFTHRGCDMAGTSFRSWAIKNFANLSSQGLLRERLLQEGDLLLEERSSAS